MKPCGDLTPIDGYAYELHELRQGSTFAVPEGRDSPKYWAIKTDTAMSKDDVNVIAVTVLGVDTKHKAAGEFHPGQTVMLDEDTYVLPADIDIYMENKCVFRTFLEETPRQITGSW